MLLMVFSSAQCLLVPASGPKNKSSVGALSAKSYSAGNSDDCKHPSVFAELSRILW